MPQKIKNQSSNLLPEEENQQVHALLQPKCITIATAVIQLYSTKAPAHTEWTKRDVGIICFEKDSFRKTYFFRMYCLRRKGLIWEQEIYKDMEYKCTRPFFQCFEGDVCIYGFNFACLNEAENMKQIVLNKLEARRIAVERKLKEQQAKEGYTNEMTPKQITNQKALTLTRPEKKKGKKSQKDQKRRLTKADISYPTDFKHIQHININSKDSMYQSILEKAGVDNKMMENRKTRELVYDFLDNYPNIDKVTEKIQKTESNPAVPKRSAPKPPQRAAPAPPPNKNQSIAKTSDVTSPPPKMAPPPPPLPPRPPSLTIPSNGTSSGNTPAPPPPPPPPPPMLSPTGDTSLTSSTMNTDIKSALLSSIREGTTLKPVSNEPIANESSRDNMLQQIKEGITLKPANERELKSPTTPPPLAEEVNTIAFALKKVLENRSNAIRSDDSTSTSSDDGDWDP